MIGTDKRKPAAFVGLLLVLFCTENVVADACSDAINISCSWGNWNSWSLCSGGQQNRYRIELSNISNCDCGSSQIVTRSCVIGKSLFFAKVRTMQFLRT